MFGKTPSEIIPPATCRESLGLASLMPTFPLLPCKKKAWVFVSDSMRKSTSAPLSLNTAPPFMSKLVPVTDVNVPTPADAPPMVTPSMVPPLMSVVVSTEDATVMTPVLSAMVADAVPSLALMLVTSMLVVSTVVALTVVMLPVVPVMVPFTSRVLAGLDVPMPTSPAEVIVKRSVPLSQKPNSPSDVILSPAL